MQFICFRFYELCSKVESGGPCQWRYRLLDSIRSSRNLETACFAAWYSRGSSNTKIPVCLVLIWGRIHIYNEENQTVHIMVCSEVTSDSDTLRLFSFRYALNMEAHIKCLDKVELIWIEKVVDGNSISENRTLRRVPQSVEPSLGREKISATTLSLISGFLTLQFEISLIFICGALLN